MDQHETPDNVYALFPGIDTKPFGARATDAATADTLGAAGWSAAPERTVTDPAPIVARAKQWLLPHPLPRTSFMRVVGWLALAVIAGAAISIARDTLVSSGPQSSTHQQTAGRNRKLATPVLATAAALQKTAAEIADFEHSRSRAVQQSRPARRAQSARHRTRAHQRATIKPSSPRPHNTQSVGARQYQLTDVQPQPSTSQPATDSAASTGGSANAPATPTRTGTAGSHPAGSTGSGALGGIGSCVKGC